MIEVEVDCPQRLPSGRFDEVAAEGNLGAHALQHLGKANVALDAVAADTLDPHRAAAERAAKAAAKAEAERLAAAEAKRLATERQLAAEAAAKEALRQSRKVKPAALGLQDLKAALEGRGK